MNPFEKIFSYQLAARLEERQIFTLTTQERSWLKLMLATDAAALAFDKATLMWLHQQLEPDHLPAVREMVVEKAASSQHTEFPAMLHPLRRIIRNKQAVVLQRQNKHGQLVAPECGVPWRLEYSAARQEWYVHWFNLDRSAPMTTRLAHIHTATEQAIAAESYNAICQRLELYIQADRHEITVQVLPIYNKELTRILHAFSCFDKRVRFDEQQQTYCIHVRFTNREREYVLNRLRFLGKRVQITEGDKFKQRMKDTAVRALARYGVDAAAASAQTVASVQQDRHNQAANHADNDDE
ncbi:WYL domain-containing protein [Paenibacillus campi]|uniref:WYL domain-containing protein n=1 Tax=Paenibacillus campi TaxID=3106031 RepID=UPI002AFDCB52|nr:WYL domain-containing protein [Paenibacillus sp. SGZ-1009]